MELLRVLLRGKGIPSRVTGGHLITGETGTLNVSTVSLVKARAYAESVFQKHGKSIDEVIPEFDKNFLQLQKAAKSAKNIARSEMPVISQEHIADFEADLKKGRIDIFKPWAFKSQHFPKDLLGKRQESEEWLQLGLQDGDLKDDIIQAKKGHTAAKDLKPIQNEIWLEKMIPYIIDFKTPIDQMTLVISKDHYIIDGHHRFGQAMLQNPSMKLKTLLVPLPIELLLLVGRSYGNAKGEHQRK